MDKEKARRGGRSARHEQRRQGLDPAERPVRPGLEGGLYRPLSQAQVETVHAAALEVLDTIGLADAIPSCVAACTRKGAHLNDSGRLCFPPKLVEDTLKVAARRFALHGQAPGHDLDLSGKKVHFGTAGAAVHVADFERRAYRESTLTDLYDAARIGDALDHIHFFQRTLVTRDLADPFELDLNTAYACIKGTTKHVGTSFVTPENLEATMPLLHAIAGSEAAWRARPFVSLSCCFVVPPLKFAVDACRTLEAAVDAGMPVLLLSAEQAGATSPAALAGTVVEEVAECLAGLVYVNAIKEGHPAIFGPWPFVSDLRTGAMSGGSGEQALLSAACAQMGQFYDLPTGVPSGMSDAKLPDVQSGLEKGLNHALVANAGPNLIYEAAGMQASLLGFSFESLVIDNDTIGMALRTLKGIALGADALSIETMREACMRGPGHYLGTEQTLRLMQSEYLYPALADRMSPKEWDEAGNPDMLTRAKRRVHDLLANHVPDHIAPGLDRDLRRRFPIRLQPPAPAAEVA